MNQSLVGIIGGSGLYQMDAVQDAQEKVDWYRNMAAWPRYRSDSLKP